MTLGRLTFLAFLPAMLALLPFVPRHPAVQASAATSAPITIAVTLDGGPLAAARLWRFEVLDGANAVETVEVSLSGDASFAQATTGPLPEGAYTVRQVFGNNMATACDPGIFFANADPVRNVQLGPAGATVNFTITVCPGAPGGVVVDRPVDDVTAIPTQGTIDEVQGTRVAGDGTPTPPAPRAPATGTGHAEAAPAAPRTSLLAALAVFLLAAPVLLTAMRRE